MQRGKDVDYSAASPPPGWKLETEYGNSVRAAMAGMSGGAAALKANVSLGELLDYVGMILDRMHSDGECIKQLQEKVVQLEERPSGTVPYEGVWNSRKSYCSGVFVTDGGSMWHARRASVGERPGSGNAWQLAVKKGRDAK